jgi:hypothetical protein
LPGAFLEEALADFGFGPFIKVLDVTFIVFITFLGAMATLPMYGNTRA